ncbi:hypothetical protein [Sphingomonas colocasiae]|uniref:Uncharacterized protein n=1 Tax=Sphingomonas colocasiae TaxID=1848973 RepID=A0ABS7PSE0_9SPHN|nr:hypothetical protein [Sphingomonas colocasiae]MBY8824257.1 hypothetical protein [Sphingomonas colocasiae]
MKATFLAASALLLCATAAGAQTSPPAADPGQPGTPLEQDRGYDKPSARTDAINAPNQAERAAANAAVAARPPSRTDMNPEAQAQYDADLAAYLTALRTRRQIAAADERLHERQQRAYADAMYVWRLQAADCRAGRREACKAPAPDPADFFE